MRNVILPGAFVLTASVLAAPALAHEGDIGLGVVDDRIQTGEIDGGSFVGGARVFGSEFGELAPNFTDEPGFDNLPGTFPFPSTISFTINKALRLWDGTDFDTIPAERISVGFGPLPPVLTPLTDTPVAGFGLAVASNGEWHRHLEYTLEAPAADGIYLLEMVLESSVPTILASEPFWLVFNQNMTETEHDEAIEWVEENLAGGGGGGGCDSIDFNGDGVTPDTLDITDFLSVFAGGPCSNDPNCGDIDFNNDNVAPDTLDIDAFLSVFGGGSCQ